MASATSPSPVLAAADSTSSTAASVNGAAATTNGGSSGSPKSGADAGAAKELTASASSTSLTGAADASEGGGGGLTPSGSGLSASASSTGGGAGGASNGTSLALRALVSTKEAGVIIGKGGSNVAELREKTGVKAGVSKVVPGVHDRVLSVNGTIEGVAEAYSFIAQTCLDNPVGADPSRTTPGSTSIRLLISHALMGTVIGKAGLTIKHIQDLSGARMVASKEMLPNSTERIVEVVGTPAAIRIAVQEIAKALLEDWERGQGTVYYQPEQTEGAGVLAASGMGGLQQQGPHAMRLGAGGAGPGPIMGGPGFAPGGMVGGGPQGPRRASAGNYLAPAMAGLVLGPGPVGPGGSIVGSRRATAGPHHHADPDALRGAAPIPAGAAAAPPLSMAPAPQPLPNGAAGAPVAAAAAAAAAGAAGGPIGGVDLLANPATAPYAAHIASLQHQSVFAPTGIPAGSATRPSAIADAAAQGAAVAPGGGLVAGGMTGAGPATAPAVVDAANMRTQNISIPSDMVGCIIGKGGSKITEIRRLSGSRISIAKVAHDETGERMFTIQGTPESNEKALFLLYNQLENEKERRTAEGAAADAAAAAAGVAPPSAGDAAVVGAGPNVA